MKSFLIFLAGAVIGVAAALFVLPGAFVGMGAGAGIATGGGKSADFNRQGDQRPGGARVE